MRVSVPPPCSGIAFRQYDQTDRLVCVVVLKATFAHRQAAEAALAPKQAPLRDADIYADPGDPQLAPMVSPSDFVPAKTGTDVTFVGLAYAPNGQPAKAWPARFQVGPVDKTIDISGPRRWQRAEQRSVWAKLRHEEIWALTPPARVEQVPVDWRLARGGFATHEQIGAFDAHNPVGGPDIRPNDDTVEDGVKSYPQIQQKGGALAGFGPLAPFYRDRQQYAGTYDAAWLEDRHPLLPTDFDSKFWNMAPPDQIVRPHLEPAARYCLTNLSCADPEAVGLLPAWSPVAALSFEGQTGKAQQFGLLLNDVQFDWRDDHLIHMVWRTQFHLDDPALARIDVTVPGVFKNRFERAQDER